MSAEIDPVKYGVLWQKVQDLDKKVDKLEAGMDELLALAAHLADEKATKASTGASWA